MCPCNMKIYITLHTKGLSIPRNYLTGLKAVQKLTRAMRIQCALIASTLWLGVRAASRILATSPAYCLLQCRVTVTR